MRGEPGSGVEGAGFVLGLRAASSDEAAVGGRRWRRLPGTSKVLGFWFSSVTAYGFRWLGTAPIGGAVWLRQVHIEVPYNSSKIAPHQFQLAFGAEAPSSKAEMDGLEQVFADAGDRALRRSTLLKSIAYASFGLLMDRVLVCNGLRIVCEFYNSSTTTVAGYLALVVDDVVEVFEGTESRVALPGVLAHLQAAAGEGGVERR